ncbi:MAG: hypothetical protein AMS15_09355 [Planctomycetes bacterium DG_23]|nr:MAG: hypothetical protein AMS15_09355 [Planctomycetes bacterium DG_23]
MNDRLRALEAIRPTKTDREKIAEVLLRVPGHGDSDTEASWTRHLVEKGKSADLLTYEPEGKGPQQRRLGRLRIMPDFDVIEIFYSRPLILHGNVKRDGIERVWGNILDTELSEMPEPDTLARLYGDFASELLYPRADSVYLKHCDKYWQEHQK